MEERIVNYKTNIQAQKITNQMLGEDFVLVRHESKNKLLSFKKITPPNTR